MDPAIVLLIPLLSHCLAELLIPNYLHRIAFAVGNLIGKRRRARERAAMAAEQQRFEKFTRFDLPGLNLPLNFIPPPVSVLSDRQRQFYPLFRTALSQTDLQDGWVSQRMIPTRELTMLHIMDALTDKPGWEEKIFNDDISEKWKKEAMSTKDRDVTEPMADWVIEELRYKAKIFKETGTVIVYDGDVVKSDTVVPSTIKAALQQAVKVLEEVPEFYKDYHPGSDGKVLDLVHPSLFPLIYGKSRVLSDSLVSLDNCLESCGKGTVVPVRSDEETIQGRKEGSWHSRDAPAPYSKHFQWLPSEVEFEADGKPKFVSYINNLHPQRYKELYGIIEEVLDRAISLWNETLTPINERARNWVPRLERIPYTEVSYDPDPETMSDSEVPHQEEDENEDDFWDRHRQWAESIRKVVLPEPGTFEPPSVAEHNRYGLVPGTTDKLLPELRVDLKRDYQKRGLQVIVKLANIELTPDKPTYEGGTWHVEGQLNEHICATALYYYDSHNITPSRLSFRQRVSGDTTDIGYPQDEHDFMQAVFGLDPDGPTIQGLGSVACLEGRLLTFPNILQHQVAPFSILDTTQPGHRKILALFLVDPGLRIISTANVPPQQREWWSEEVVRTFAQSGTKLSKLSTELKQKVFEGVDDFPIGIEEAKEIRKQLMEERKRYVVDQKTNFEMDSFSLCEH